MNIKLDTLVDNETKRALGDVTILDLSRVICGPFATMILGDFGANIIKVEAPGIGDDTRSWEPFSEDYSIFFSYVNRNKRSVTINLKSEEGKKLLLELVKHADVVVENFRPGVMKKLGLDYESLKKVNEKIIYASASGFGTYGPYSHRPGYDVIGQAMGGIMSLIGPIDGEPYKAGCALADVTTGMNLAIGILTALHYRQLTGKGQYFETSLTESILTLISVETTEYLYNGVKTKRLGNKNIMLSPYGNYKASDGEFVLCCGNQKLYEELCNKAMHQPELIDDPRFSTLSNRAANYDILKEIVDEWASQYTVSEVTAILETAGIPAAPILDIEQIYHDPHFHDAREMFLETEHPSIGKYVTPGTPYKFSETKTQIYNRAPYLGEHNEEIFQSMLGKTKEEVKRLKEIGAI